MCIRDSFYDNIREKYGVEGKTEALKAFKEAAKKKREKKLEDQRKALAAADELGKEEDEPQRGEKWGRKYRFEERRASPMLS